MKKLYKFYWDCYRNGSLEGVFVAEESEVTDAMGSTAYFGEVLGKHSEVQGVLEEKDITLVTDNPEVIKVFEEHFQGSIGWNPLCYIQCEHWINTSEEECEECEADAAADVAEAETEK